MSDIYVGMDVYWYKDSSKSASPCAAKITKIESEREQLITVAIFLPNMPATKPARGVRNRGDKWLITHPDHVLTHGVWDFMPSQIPQARNEKVSK